MWSILICGFAGKANFPLRGGRSAWKLTVFEEGAERRELHGLDRGCEVGGKRKGDGDVHARMWPSGSVLRGQGSSGRRACRASRRPTGPCGDAQAPPHRGQATVVVAVTILPTGPAPARPNASPFLGDGTTPAAATPSRNVPIFKTPRQ